MTREALERGAIAVVVALWAASLALPALDFPGGPTVRGIEVLVRGAQALDSGVFAWLANPAFLTAAALAWGRSWRSAAAIAALGSALALTSFGAEGFAERSGASVPEFTFAPGFYLWLATHFALFACCWPRMFPGRDTARR